MQFFIRFSNNYDKIDSRLSIKGTPILNGGSEQLRNTVHFKFFFFIFSIPVGATVYFLVPRTGPIKSEFDCIHNLCSCEVGAPKGPSIYTCSGLLT